MIACAFWGDRGKMLTYSTLGSDGISWDPARCLWDIMGSHGIPRPRLIPAAVTNQYQGRAGQEQCTPRCNYLHIVAASCNSAGVVGFELHWRGRDGIQETGVSCASGLPEKARLRVGLGLGACFRPRANQPLDRTPRQVRRPQCGMPCEAILDGMAAAQPRHEAGFHRKHLGAAAALLDQSHQPQDPLLDLARRADPVLGNAVDPTAGPRARISSNATAGDLARTGIALQPAVPDVKRGSVLSRESPSRTTMPGRRPQPPSPTHKPAPSRGYRHSGGPSHDMT